MGFTGIKPPSNPAPTAPSDPEPDPEPEPAKPLEIPESFGRRKPKTTRQMSKFRADFIRATTPQMVAAVLSALYEGVQSGDHQHIKIASDIYGLTPEKKGIAVNVNQNNANLPASQSVRDDTVTFEKVIRARAEAKKLQVSQQTIDVTKQVQ